jgi:hypothetical protein
MREEKSTMRVKTAIRLHLAGLKVAATSNPLVKKHLAALTHPLGIEKPLMGLFNCTADYADAFYRRNRIRVSDAGIAADEWIKLITAILALSADNIGIGRLEQGMLEQLAREIVVAAGFASSAID